MMRSVFPFSAIVGQDDMKLALILSAVDSRIGGVLAFGDRGAGKSTAVRALAQLLPDMTVVAGCRFHCDPNASAASCASVCSARAGDPGIATVRTPVVDLPLGATEDRVLGALDIERALTRGEKAFEPGLLARAHRGFLYIDEVNLLEDHLVDLLLDVAASGVNVVEREGLSVTHPARFILIGSGNPEEGELRPQLLDRFGLCVDVTTPTDLSQRIEVVRRVDAFDRDPEGFRAAWAEADAEVREAILAARARVDAVTAAPDMLEILSKLSIAIGADGLRGELTLLRAARASAAYAGADAVGPDDIRRVAPMALRHRLRRNPLDDVGSGARIERALVEVLGA